MTMQHTPGPWVIKGISMEDGSYSVGPSDIRIVIAYVTNAASFGDFVNASLKGRRDFGAPDTAHTQRANAQLIAAAPDMFAALQGVLRVADRKTDEFNAARAAIAKANGIQK